jgi:hypothetical protein
MPARADTIAMVGTMPLVSFRPRASWMSKSPTVRYSAASASEAPPNLCTFGTESKKKKTESEFK